MEGKDPMMMVGVSFLGSHIQPDDVFKYQMVAVFSDDFAESTPPVSKRPRSDNRLSRSKKKDKNNSGKGDSASTSKTRGGTERWDKQ